VAKHLGSAYYPADSTAVTFDFSMLIKAVIKPFGGEPDRPLLRERIVWALSLVNNKQSIDRLIGIYLTERDANVGGIALRAILNYHDKAWVAENLDRRLVTENANIKKVFSIFGTLHDPSFLQILTRRLGSSQSQQVRTECIRNISRYNDPAAAEALRKVIELDPGWEPRKEAIAGLARMRVPGTVEVLLRLLNRTRMRGSESRPLIS
jgi:HEAT repeat protein